MRYAFAISLSATILLAAVAVAQVYPIRWDDEEPQHSAAEATVSGGAAVAGALRLIPQDVEPVACSEQTEGYLYIQKDNTGDSPTYSSLLCICVFHEVSSTYAYYNTGNRNCELMQTL